MDRALRVFEVEGDGSHVESGSNCHFTLYAEAHRFRSDFGALDFGEEVDASVAWQILPNMNLRLQHARYDPGSGRFTDPEIRKTWLTLTVTF